jgi:hypothetical protein
MYYTGVGSRKVPQDIARLMTRIAIKLDLMGMTLRSGGADGSDKAFEKGAGAKEIFYAKDATTEAMEIAADFHPAWNRCSDYAKRLHGRNAFQVMGRELNRPSLFLVCWTPDGCENHVERTIKTGGTGTAISIANWLNVLVINLARRESREPLEAFVCREDAKLRTIYTGHYRYAGPDRTDITVKGQDPMGKLFAPSWDMVMGVKKGTMTEKMYISEYLKILRNVPFYAWEWLCSVEERTFVCFCPEQAFCHRNILANYMLSTPNKRIKYGGWRI